MAVRRPAVPEVVTGFVQRQKHSLGRDTWEDKFLVCQEGKLRYYNSDKEYLLASTNGCARRAFGVGQRRHAHSGSSLATDPLA